MPINKLKTKNRSKRRGSKKRSGRSKKKFLNPETKKILSNILQNPDLKKIENAFVVNSEVQKYNHKFSKYIDYPLPKQTNQKNSGRCWIYGFLNSLRPKFISKWNLPLTFQFSVNYLFFYHKLEMACYFLDNVQNYFKNNSDTKYYEEQLYLHLTFTPESDGGYYNFIIGLINKYGIIPNNIFRNTIRSNNTEQFNDMMRENLIYYSDLIRKNPDQDIQKFKDKVREFLEIFLGKPPEPDSEFIFTYYKKQNNKKILQRKKITPLEFVKLIGFNPSDYISCMNYPTHAFNKFFNIKYCQNNKEYPTLMYNLPMEKLIQAIILSIDANEPVCFCCDYDKYNYKLQGILDDSIFDYQSIYEIDKEIKKVKTDKQISNLKKKLINSKLSTSNHIMVIIGYDKNSNGEITRFKVENSHGEDDKKENKGYITMSLKWFKLFGHSIFVKKEFLKNIRIRKEIIEVKPWGQINC